MTTLAVNIKFTKAITQFTNYRFSSMCNFNGTPLGVNDLGLFKLTGDTDNTESIDASFTPVLSMYGKLSSKRMRQVYLSFMSTGTLKFIVKDANGKVYSYPFRCAKVGEQQYKRLIITRGIHKVYWDYTIENENGADFSIDLITCMFINRSPGHNDPV